MAVEVSLIVSRIYRFNHQLKSRANPYRSMLKFASNVLAILIAVLVAFKQVEGHGMMLDPISRSSRWRVDSTAPTNYDDNGLYCGGFSVQWGKNGGKCGLCGDDYSLPRPRPNELGGLYGQGGIVKHYKNTYTAYVSVRVTANHLGFFYFHLCDISQFGEESDACFNKYLLKLIDGSNKLYIGSTVGLVNTTVVFPEGLSCKHCVLRWSYQGGNNWGYCEDGSGAMGCGAQENFKGCADISIEAPTSRSAVGVVVPGSIIKVPVDVDDAPVVPEEISNTIVEHSSE